MALINVATSHLLALALVLALGVSQLAHGQQDMARRIVLAPCLAGEYSTVSPAPTAIEPYNVDSLFISTFIP